MKLTHLVLGSLALVPGLVAAQAYPAPTRDSTRDSVVAKQPPPAPPIDFSGILFANFQYRGDKGPAKASNRFDVERVYLTFRMPAGEHTSVRVTTDVFQQTTPGNDSYYPRGRSASRGWTGDGLPGPER